MATIYAAFRNHYGESRLYYIWDQGRDQNAPPVIFSGYLEPDQTTDWLPLYDDGWGARAVYQRSDGPQQVVDSIHDGDQVDMD